MNPHAAHFSRLATTQALDLSAETAAILDARASMGVLYGAAALMVQTAVAHGHSVVLEDVRGQDRFDVRARGYEVHFARTRAEVRITYRNFARSLVPESEVLQIDGDESPQEFARRTITRIRDLLWPPVT